jgi:hypothetical protein
MKKEVYISIGLHQENSGKAASFAVKGYPVSDEEKKRRTNGIVLAVVRALSTLETSGIPMSFLTVSEAAKNALG